MRTNSAGRLYAASQFSFMLRRFVPWHPFRFFRVLATSCKTETRSTTLVGGFDIVRAWPFLFSAAINLTRESLQHIRVSTLHPDELIRGSHLWTFSHQILGPCRFLGPIWGSVDSSMPPGSKFPPLNASIPSREIFFTVSPRQDAAVFFG